LLDSSIGQDVNWRFEYKYRLTYDHYLRVRSFILPYMKKDPFTAGPGARRYVVRSLYFDTDKLDAFVEKLNGDQDRVKLRIRSYQSDPENNMKLRVEFKSRKGMAMEKHSTWVSLDAYQQFMDTHHWTDHSDPVLSEFERYVHLKGMRPKVLVEYEREGYLSRIDRLVRTTFDHHVKSAQAEDLFPQNAIFRNFYPGMLVFEIKCDKRQPFWLRKLVQELGLKLAANSKFAQGVELSRQDVIRSTWSSEY
jgi:hypothetical protein